jgi:hypothetical protein
MFLNSFDTGLVEQVFKQIHRGIVPGKSCAGLTCRLGSIGIHRDAAGNLFYFSSLALDAYGALANGELSETCSGSS